MAHIRTIAPDEADAVLDLIIAEQSDPATATCYVGTVRDEVRLELADLGDAWPASVLVVEQDGRLVGATVTDADPDIGRSWIHGPWVDAEHWDAWAAPILQAAIAACPAGVVRHEMSSDAANVRMAELARQLGWKRSVPNQVYVADAAAATGWPPDDDRVRPLRAGDFEAVDALHTAEFPHTYLPTRQLIDQSVAGDLISLVSEDPGGRFLGYASGRVQPDGAGYLDFIAITPSARGAGAGVGLLATIGRRILSAAEQHNVNLTVQDHRLAAIAAYRRLGFVLETTIVGYSSPTPSG
jgi:ribosomal protein S18 acetylase RimI-like enzyme